MFEAAECDAIFKIGSLEKDTCETQNWSIGVLDKLTIIVKLTLCLLKVSMSRNDFN